MKGFRAGYFALLLSPMLVAACTSQQTLSTQELNYRLHVLMASDVSAGRVTVERLGDGARLTLNEASLYQNGASALNDDGHTVLTNFVQAMLDPSLLRIDVANEPVSPGSLQEARTKMVTQFLTGAGLGRALQPATDAMPAGMTITVRIIHG